MPRTTQEILDQADELAARFESHQPDLTNLSDAAALRAVRLAFQARAGAERRLAEAVSVARADGHSWAAIGAMVGTSGEAAREWPARYGALTTHMSHPKRSHPRRRAARDLGGDDPAGDSD